MERIEFQIESSSGGGEYTVVFQIDGDKVNAYCTCQAGQSGSFCKHRVAIISGDVDDLVSENRTDIVRLQSLIQGSELKAAYDRYIAAEIVYRDSEKELKNAKKALTKAMYQ